jgi:hypothetical protein
MARLKVSVASKAMVRCCGARLVGLSSADLRGLARVTPDYPKALVRQVPDAEPGTCWGVTAALSA